MMIIHQEIYSIFGNFRTSEIVGITGIHKRDQQEIRGFDTPQDVIWCKLGKKEGQEKYHYHPIAFPRRMLRDEAFEKIQSSASPIIVLDYNRYFCPDILGDDSAKNVISSSGLALDRHLRHCFSMISNDVGVLKELDAFKNIGISTLLNIQQNTPFYIPITQAEIWAKTLVVPRTITSSGVSKRQFYRNLITKNNEEYTNRNHRPDTRNWSGL